MSSLSITDFFQRFYNKKTKSLLKLYDNLRVLYDADKGKDGKGVETAA